MPRFKYYNYDQDTMVVINYPDLDPLQPHGARAHSLEGCVYQMHPQARLGRRQSQRG